MKIKKQSFTLIELMGTMVIATILIAMLMKIFGSSSQLMSKKFRSIDTYAQARTALNMISRDVSNLYTNGTTLYQLESKMLTFYSYGSIDRPSSGTDQEIAKAIASPYRIVYKESGGKLVKDVLYYEPSIFGYKKDSNLSGNVISEGLKSIRFDVRNKNGSQGRRYPTAEVDHDNDPTTPNTVISKPYSVTVTIEVEEESSTGKNGETREFRKTIITDSSY